MNKNTFDIIENIHYQKREDLLMGSLNEDYIKCNMLLFQYK